MNDIHQKELLLRSILKNTQEQTKAIKDDQLEDAEKLISQRHDMMQQVDKLDQKIKAAGTKTLKDLAKSMADILAQTISTDGGNQKLIQKNLDNMGKDISDVKEELRNMRQRKKQSENYLEEYGLHKEEGIFFDKKE